MDIQRISEITNIIAIAIGLIIVMCAFQRKKYKWIPILQLYFLVISLLDIIYFAGYKYFPLQVIYLSYLDLFANPVFIFLLANTLKSDFKYKRIIQALFVAQLLFLGYRTVSHWGSYDGLSWFVMQLFSAIVLLISLYTISKNYISGSELKFLLPIYTALFLMFFVPIITNPFQTMLAQSSSFIHQLAFIFLNSVAAISYLLILFTLLKIPRKADIIKS